MVDAVGDTDYAGCTPSAYNSARYTASYVEIRALAFKMFNLSTSERRQLCGQGDIDSIGPLEVPARSKPQPPR
jgi:hypothetical protein